MRFEDEDLEQMDKVNRLMDSIHSHVDNIYEDLMDEDYPSLVLNLQSLIVILRKLLKKHRS
tara:strand:- start:60 stop:242 length:183 start_codon:yes stop_codon:yes gene_type:complete